MENVSKRQANIDAAKIIDDYIIKAAEITKAAKENGTWQRGLDSNNHLYDEIRRERDEKLRALASSVKKT